jgi:hypothetical protein
VGTSQGPLARDISSPFENQLILELGYRKRLSMPPTTGEVVAAAVTIVDD